MEAKLIVKQMKDAGMSEKDMLSSLEELGIEDAKNVLKKALQELQTEQPKAASGSAATQKPEEAGGLQITSISEEGEKIVELEKMFKDTEQGGGEVMRKIPKSDLSNIDEVEYKLDQVIALLKALNELNKKILETNRDLLVKMSKKEPQQQPKERLF